LLDCPDRQIERELFQFGDGLGQPHEREMPMHNVARLGIDIAPGVLSASPDRVRNNGVKGSSMKKPRRSEDVP
jgi:hypothetical protein